SKRLFKKAVSAVAVVEHGEKQQQVQAYSTYTGSEPRQWWIASAECRQADMSRLLGLNPKLVNWNTALHYASKYSSAQCMRLLLDQYKANVNARS
ncbi:hypothetical protein X801_04065, partial [Opisthorchis viverrini]